jgi:short-subunit dehydrogenase
MPSALVTGASSGIGLELARLLARDGYEITLAARSADKLTDLAQELGGARTIEVDLSRADGPSAITAQLESVDVLVNNAGVGDFGPFAAADLAKTRGMIQLNVTSLTELTRAYLPGMLERGSGRVLNVASTAAFQPGPLMAVYYATKSYVLSFSEAIAEETRGSGVTVTALCPGPTASGFQAGAAMEDSKLVAGRKLPTAAHVAEAGYKAMQRGDVVEVVGAKNRIMAASVRFSPRPVMRRMVHRIQAAKS